MALTEQEGSRGYRLHSDGRVERTMVYIGDRNDEALVPAAHPDDANATLREVTGVNYKGSGGSACDDQFLYTATYRTSITKPTIYEYGGSLVQTGPVTVDLDGKNIPSAIQVYVAQPTYTVVKRVTTAAWNAAKAQVYALVNKTNSAACSPWDGNAQNTMLFLVPHATRESDDAYWTVRYTFVYDANLHRHREWNSDTSAWEYFRIHDEGDFSALP